tara:strand:- start:1742 stop:2149 length:408 start_codon:yes stop_codon:yes gene_type:complete
MGFKMKGFPYPGKSPMKNKDLKQVAKELRGAVKAHGKQASLVEKHIKEMESSPMKQKNGGKIIYKDGKKYYKASDGTLHTGQVSDYEAELAEDKKMLEKEKARLKKKKEQKKKLKKVDTTQMNLLKKPNKYTKAN